MHYKYKKGSESIKELKDGANQVADMVGITLGPKGRPIVIQREYGKPIVTRDGVTVARHFSLKDQYKEQGVLLMKQVSTKMDDLVGDGTTTAMVIARALLNQMEFESYLGVEVDMLSIKKQIFETMEKIVNKIDEKKIIIESPEDIYKVAFVSSLDENISRMIMEIYKIVGKDGIITWNETKNTETTFEIKQGFEINRGYISGYMVNNPQTQEAIWEDSPILVTDEKIDSMDQIGPIVQKLVTAGVKKIVIVCEDMDVSVSSFLIASMLKGGVKSLVIKAPGFGERKPDQLMDICAVTGAKLISKTQGKQLETMELKDLGSANEVRAGFKSTLFIGGAGAKEDVENRINQIKQNMTDVKVNEIDLEFMKKRIARLTGGVGIIKLGAPTESVMEELAYKVEDAIGGVKAALAGGIVAGGGTCLRDIAEELRLSSSIAPTQGGEILLNAIEEPYKKILSNAGLKSEGKNINVLTGEEVSNMVEAGIIDPANTIKTAVKNAVSVVTQIYDSGGVMIIDEDEKKLKDNQEE